MTRRWELLRALGAVADSPAAARAVAGPLGLDPAGDAEHTEVFVLNCPPYASVYLGPDGALGGEGADRVAGFWRALAISPPAEPDHLTALLALYASLGEAAAQARRPATAQALIRSRQGLFAEHLWPWLPAYLDAVADLAVPALTAWAELSRRAITAEFSAQPAWPPARAKPGWATGSASAAIPCAPCSARIRRPPWLGPRTRRRAGNVATPAGRPGTRSPAGGPRAPDAPRRSYGTRCPGEDRHPGDAGVGDTGPGMPPEVAGRAPQPREAPQS